MLAGYKLEQGNLWIENDLPYAVRRNAEGGKDKARYPKRYVERAIKKAVDGLTPRKGARSLRGTRR